MLHSQGNEAYSVNSLCSVGFIVLGQAYSKRGFALPTVLIASLVMLMVLVTGLVSSVATGTSLRNQSYQRLSELASESGTEKARSCLMSNYQSVTWTDSKPLTPATDCSGNIVAGQSAYILNAGGLQTTFKVGRPDTTTSTGVFTVTSNGTLQRIRTSNGQVWRSYGSVSHMKISVPLMTSLDGGYQHSIGLSSNRSTIYAWGDNTHGQLGDGSTENMNSPGPVIDRSSLDGSYIKQVIGGGFHTLALTDNGNVYAWGLNAQCQLGVGDSTSRLRPTAVTTTGTPMAGKRIVSIGAGKYHSLAVDDQGVAYAWGDNSEGQIGDGTIGTARCAPVAVATTGTAMAGKRIDIIKSNSNSLTTIALDLSEGRAYTWGDNGNGKLGIGTTSIANVNVPNAVKMDGTAMDGLKLEYVESTTNASYFLSSDNRIFAVGGNFAGQFANLTPGQQGNSPSAKEIPTAGTPLAGKEIVQISGDGHHGTALDSDGVVYGWGWNKYGQVGVGTLNNPPCDPYNTSEANTNVCVAPIAAVVTAGTPMAGRHITSISTGDRWTYAVASDGTGYSWGHNAQGQLGIKWVQDIETLPSQMIFQGLVLRY